MTGVKTSIIPVPHLYMEMQKRLRIEAVEKTTSMALYMSHSQTEKSQWPSNNTLIALNTIAPTDTERSEQDLMREIMM